MQWVEGDLIEICNRLNADGVVFSANSVVLSNGELCLGAGAALRVRNAFPKAALVLGNQIKQDGYNWVQPDYYLAGCVFDAVKPFYVFALQVKRDFRHKGDIQLTIQSLKDLAAWCEENPEVKLVMNCPLIGLGGYSSRVDEVKEIVSSILKNTSIVVTIL
jgi:hypothetical protein